MSPTNTRRSGFDRNASTDIRQRAALQAQADATEDLQIAGPTWMSFNATFEQFLQGDTARSVIILQLGARQAIHAAVLKHLKRWKGGAINAVTQSIGISGAIDKYLPPYDVFQSVGDSKIATAANFGVERWKLDEEDEGVKIYLHTITTGANLDKLTQGESEVRLLISQIP